MVRVLVVDDDPTVREVATDYLRRAGHEVVAAADGPGALAAAQDHPPAAAVLDVMLPGVDGHELCRQLRRDHPGLPVVMLSALGEEEDRVRGLVTGADDYVVKPFSPRELVLRLHSVLRRAGEPSPEPVTDGDLMVDPAARRATRGGRDLGLTVREFDLLAHLVRHPGTAHSREDLLRRVWGWDFGDLSTVTVHVRRVRAKVEDDPAVPTRLVTVWGVGYRWDPS
ncbi:MAG: response regulator transcription factor [Kineosporiaceae bacterium]